MPAERIPPGGQVASGPRSVAASQISGVVVTGDRPQVDARAPVLAAGGIPRPADVVIAARMNNLPRPPAAVFVGREDVLTLLEESLAGGGSVVVTQAVFGLGGVGKSELALQYAHAHRCGYQLIWWVTAEDGSQIEAGLAGLAGRICPDLALAVTTAEAAAWAVTWLQAYSGWLLILDDVSDPGDVEPLLGQLHGGHVLLTTRRDTGWQRIAAPVRLEVLAPGPAAVLITATTGRVGPGDAQAAAEIAVELGFLPLALDQAAAYITQARIPLTRYLELLRQHPARMYAAGMAGAQAQRTIARLWDITLKAIGRADPSAADLLRVLACYAPDSIPRRIIGGHDAGPGEDEALGLLASYSIITLTAETVSMHKLVQAVILAAPDDTGSGPPPRDTALAWLDDALPPDPDRDVAAWPFLRALIPHAEALAGRYPSGEKPVTLARVLRAVSSARGAVFLLRGSVSALMSQVAARDLVPHLREQFSHVFGKNPSAVEVRSWERSVPALLRHLTDAGLHDVQVLLEYRLPLTSKRADVVLLGCHPQGGPSCVVVENKQWSRVVLADTEYRLVAVSGLGEQERLHPQEQVRRYAEYLEDFNRFLGERPGAVAGCVFLHNATWGAIAGLRHPDLADLAAYPAFAGDEVAALRSFLTRRLAPVPGVQVADDALQSVIAPSKQLLRLVPEEITANPQFTLLDEQQVAYQVVLRAVEHARRADAKEIVLVTGGPGSGKSVIAIALLAELAKRGYNVSHATGSRSFTIALRQVVGRRVPRVKAFFRYTNNFMDTERNSLDVLIVDEAHRIRATSTNRFTRAARRTGTPQAAELVQAARVPVFLLDEHQVVRPDEIGTVASIEQAAAANGAVVRRIDLNGQFRCGGSPVYARWVENLLGLRPGGPQPWQPDDAFELSLAGSPDQMEWELRGKISQGYVARIAAGFCWPWSKPRPDGTLVDDVKIGSWSRPWNLLSDRAVNGIPPSALWATDDAGFWQVGCVYTAQGFEYEYGGVIIGGDLVWRDDHWETRPAASSDRDIKRAANSDELIRNVYKVLLTRGLRGCIIYSVDQETRQMLAGLKITQLEETSRE